MSARSIVNGWFVPRVYYLYVFETKKKKPQCRYDVTSQKEQRKLRKLTAVEQEFL